MYIKTFFTGCLLLLILQQTKGQLNANFSADMLSGCAPIRVVFTDMSAGNPTGWRWDLGNGTIAENTNNPSTTYLVPGTFSVKLTIYNGSDSSTIIKTNYITVFPNPSIYFNSSPTSGCVPVNVQFNDSSKLGTSGTGTYQWDFGDGNIGTGKNPQHTYNSPGSFKVTLTAKNSFGCVSSDSKLNYITAYDSIRAGFSIKAPGACAIPATYLFSDSSIGSGITKRTWDFGDGTTSNATNPAHAYISQGSYTVKLIIENNNGCVDTLVKKDAIMPGNYKANFTLPATACVGKIVSFINASVPSSLIDSSRWSFGNGKTATTLNPTTSYSSTGVYKIKLVTWFGSCADSTENSITVLPQPEAAFSATPTGACKPPLKVQFNNLTSGGTVFKWNFGNNNSSTVANPVMTYTEFGSYDVSLIVQNANGCIDTIVKKDFINILPPTISAIAGLPYEGCMPWTGNLSLNVNSPDPVVKYEWNFGDGTTSTAASPTHTFTDTTQYTITAIITTSSGCMDTITSYVHGGLRPKSDFKGGPRIICPLTPVTFTSLSSVTANSWFWEFGDGGTSTEENPSYLYKDTGDMDVSLVAFNNGCPDTILFKNYIYVYPPIAHFIDSVTCIDPYTFYFSDDSKGGTYWKWYFDGTDSVEAKNTIYTFKDTGTYTVLLYIKDSLCDNNATHYIKVIDEKAAFLVTDSGVCGVSYKRFTAQGPRTNPTNIKEYNWDFGDGTALITDTASVIHQYQKSGVMNVRLIITDIHGCMDTTSMPVDVRLYGPLADFSPPVSKVCAGSVVTFYDSSSYNPSIPIVKWQFNFGNGIDTTFNSQPFTTIYNDAGVYDVKITVEDTAGCRHTLLKRRAVYVYKPVANFNSPDTIICINTPAQFVNMSSGALLKSVWNFGDGNSSTSSDPSNSYAALGKYDVKLLITDSLGCQDSMVKPKYISVEQAYAEFSVSDSFTTCPPLVVLFKNSSVNNILNKWDFGNGNSSSLTDPSHTYTTPGTFIAKLIVTGNGGCNDSATKIIAIRGPSGKFTYGPLGGCPPLQVFFESNAINTKAITWDFSDGESNLSVDSVVNHIYKIPGTYVPKVIFADDLGCKLPVQGKDTIRVIGAKAFIRSIPSPYFCDSTNIQFFDSTITTDVIKSYSWNFGDGTQSSERNPVHTYSKIGQYRVTFEVQTMTGCVSKDTLPEPVIISKTPKIVIGPDQEVCVPASLQYNAVWTNKDTTTVQWHWSFGNGMSSSLLQPPVIRYDQPGNYNISLVGANRYGCADTSLKVLVVNDTPNVVAGPSSVICLGKNVALTAAGGVSYRWDNNASLSCINCKDPVASPTSQQVYRVVATDSNGCKSSDTVLVRVQLPGNLLTGPGDTLCLGESFNLKASGTQRYLWSPPDGLSSTTIGNPVSKPLQTTNYQVLGSDSLGCFTDTGYVELKVYPVPKFDITEETISALTGTVLKLETTSSADITRWHWTPPFGLSCTNCAQPDVTVATAITYTATATNPGFCRVSDKVTIVPVCNGDNVYIPNTFSPNGDGQNDRFYPRGKGVSLVKSMRIFNRWGELVFEHKDFAFNDPGAGWNGTYKSTLLTPDVYVYIVEVLCDNNVIYNVKGNVTLLK
ncbi:MAG: PKD domain-containing protein [Bacteroidota bacterium]